jgi:hypothetical protein
MLSLEQCGKTYVSEFRVLELLNQLEYGSPPKDQKYDLLGTILLQRVRNRLKLVRRFGIFELN